MDAFTKKHLKAWLQNSVFSDERRKVGKLIRAYVKRHPEVITESRSWPEIQRLAEASGTNPRDTTVLQKKRAARERAAQIRAASGRNPRRVTFDSSINKYTAHKYLKKYGNIIASGKSKAEAVRNLKAAIARAKGGQRNPAELLIMGANPRVEVVAAPNPPTEEIVEEFTGREVEFMDVYNEPHMPRGRYAKLGPLVALYIKPAKGGQVQRIGASEAVGHDFPKAWGGRPPLVVCDSSARQIYFVDGAQDISEALAAFGAIDRGNGIVELGQGRRIDYQCRKEHVAEPDEDLWKHEHGEENGALPTVLFDTRNKRLLYEGGDYRIEGPWIRN
jgi:hypothetical protein